MKNNNNSPTQAFSASAYIKNNKSEAGAIAAGTGLGAALLGTTAITGALSGPFMGLPAFVLPLTLLAGSIYMLYKTGDTVVEAASAAGAKNKLSPSIIGVILGAMTSMPELAASVGAVAQGAPHIGLENIIGSNIANPLLILGATALISPLVASKSLTTKFNYRVIGLTAAAVGTCALFGTLPIWAGYAALASFIGYSAYMMWKDKPPAETEEPTDKQKTLRAMPGWFNYGWGIAGLAGLIGAASLLVASAQAFASTAGIPQSIVGPILVAVGTSLPEFVVSVGALMKGKSDMALSNIFGSNIMNILMVGGATSLAASMISGAPITLPDTLNPMTAVGLLNIGTFGVASYLLAKTMKDGGDVSRWKGLAWVGLYAGFLAASCYLGGSPAPEAAAATAVAPAAIAALPTIAPLPA